MRQSKEIPNVTTWMAIAVGTCGAMALAAAHPTIAAAVGSAELSILGIPQIVKNFRERAAAAGDVSVDSTLIWFFVAFFLSLSSWIRQSSGWYIVLNVAGVVESAVLLAQINVYARPAGAFKKSVLGAGAAFVAGFLALGGRGMPAATWAYFLFPAAMGLLIVMNVPQILKNYELYRRQGTAPQGITPYYPALVVTGSLLHLIVATQFGDVFWALNSFVAVGSGFIILGQILLPDTTNVALAQLAGWRRAWDSEWA